MNGDLHGSDSGASRPLPPAYTQRAQGSGVAQGEQRPQAPFFPGEAYAEATFAPPPGAAADAPPVSAFESAADLPPVTAFEDVAPESPFGAESAMAPEESAAPAASPGQEKAAAPEPPPRQAHVTPIAAGTIPADAIYLPDAEIPKPRREEPEATVDFGGPVRRPQTGSEAVLVAARLEMLAKRLRERGNAALDPARAGDALDTALVLVVAGYLSGRSH